MSSSLPDPLLPVRTAVVLLIASVVAIVGIDAETAAAILHRDVSNVRRLGYAGRLSDTRRSGRRILLRLDAVERERHRRTE